MLLPLFPRTALANVNRILALNPFPCPERSERTGGHQAVLRLNSCSSKKAPPSPYCSSCRLISSGDKWLPPRTKSANLLGARSLETTTQAGKSGLRQARRSSSRAPLVSVSACSRYSSSVRNLPAGLTAARHRFVFLKHAAFGCWSPGHS